MRMIGFAIFRWKTPVLTTNWERKNMKENTKKALWLAAYIFMVIIPLILLVIFPRPAPRELLREVSVILGFLAMSMWGVQTIPINRIPFLIDLFSRKSLRDFHYNLSIPAFIFALAHPILLFINNPQTLRLLNIFARPVRANYGVFSLLLMIALLITAVWRSLFKLHFKLWRWIHDVLAFLAIAFGLLHMFRINYYMATLHQQVIWIALTIVWVTSFLYFRISQA